MGKIDIDNLDVAIEDILDNYKGFVFEATEEGLDEAEEILINNLKDRSPKKTGKYKKSWKSKGKKNKMRRIIGNTVTVKGRNGPIPLSNILEYSSKSKHQGLIKATYLDSVDQMTDAIMEKIKEGGKT